MRLGLLRAWPLQIDGTEWMFCRRYAVSLLRLLIHTDSALGSRLTAGGTGTRSRSVITIGSSSCRQRAIVMAANKEALTCGCRVASALRPGHVLNGSYGA